MPQPKGRNRSTVRTPLWVRDYLGGRSSTLAPTLADSTPVEPAVGDYVSRMHQRLKAYIRSVVLEPGHPTGTYQYPRRHSFGSLVSNLMTLGLLERTGETQEPEERGAGLGSPRGFALRTWVRLTPGSEDRDEWADPIGYLAKVYPGLRPEGRSLPVLAPPAPARLRRRAPAVPREPPSEPAPELSGIERQVAFLDQRRETVRSHLLTAAVQANRAETFRALAAEASDFLDEVAAIYPAEQFPTARADLDLLKNCVVLLEQEHELTQLRVRRLENCRNSARLVAGGLASRLQPPEAPVLAPPPTRRRRSRVALPTEAPAGEVPTISLPENWTSRSADRIIRHLGELAQLDASLIADEVKRLKDAAEAWRAAAATAQTEEEEKDNPDEDRIDRLTDQQEFLEQLRDALDPGEVEPGETLDLEQAIDILRGA